jgi:hypothetical protein
VWLHVAWHIGVLKVQEVMTFKMAHGMISAPRLVTNKPHIPFFKEVCGVFDKML